LSRGRQISPNNPGNHWVSARGLDVGHEKNWLTTPGHLNAAVRQPEGNKLRPSDIETLADKPVAHTIRFPMDLVLLLEEQTKGRGGESGTLRANNGC
jgi:hypothetical protein